MHLMFFFQQSASKEHLEDLLSICNNDIPEVTQLYCKNINILAFLAFDCWSNTLHPPGRRPLPLILKKKLFHLRIDDFRIYFTSGDQVFNGGRSSSWRKNFQTTCILWEVFQFHCSTVPLLQTIFYSLQGLGSHLHPASILPNISPIKLSPVQCSGSNGTFSARYFDSD